MDVPEFSQEQMTYLEQSLPAGIFHRVLGDEANRQAAQVKVDAAVVQVVAANAAAQEALSAAADTGADVSVLQDAISGSSDVAVSAAPVESSVK